MKLAKVEKEDNTLEVLLMKKRLYKIEEGKKVFGVCGGIAEYFDIDPTLVRLICILLIFCVGGGLLAYIIAALVMPRKSDIA